MLNHYNLQGKQVLMVSLSEQVMRVYQNGKLVRAFYVTTGRSELPSPPGVWSILDRRTPLTFVSGEPQNSPYWFPPTPIKYAILYHYGGDFVHDAWWRQSFGPGTQFPHADAGGNTSYNFDGSHGCINLTTSDASWVYKNTNWNTVIVVY
ncbi:MAG TPA: L,D-transpeptidase [Ktedonobacteraceae bacterium]|nr:L,D-transpeptidase [Ktedonobacteraceae bacterium]